jgi:hypothetical protein
MIIKKRLFLIFPPPTPGDNIIYKHNLKKSMNNILDVFQNTAYSMALKTRWDAIKKLQKTNPFIFA